MILISAISFVFVITIDFVILIVCCTIFCNEGQAINQQEVWPYLEALIYLLINQVVARLAYLYSFLQDSE